jgi:EmrB/QacA subfamily drug resistance transporter
MSVRRRRCVSFSEKKISSRPVTAPLDNVVPERRGRPRLALAVMVTAQFMVILDASIINVALPTIQRSLGFTTVSVEGVITAYATAFGGLLILGGRLSDLFGHRHVFLAGLLAFGTTSLACGLAASPAFLVIARVAQGLSAALLAPSALALLTTTFSEGVERNRALGVFGAATALGFVAGQVLGGGLTDAAGWRSVFLINGPIAGLAVALTLRVITDLRPSGPRRRPDVIGAILITAAAALLTWAPMYGSTHGWASGVFLGSIAVTVVLVVVFLVVENRSRDPLIRLSMLRSQWLLGTTIATSINGAVNGAVFLLCTLYLQQVRDYGPLRAGIAIAPAGIAGLIAGIRLAGPLITRFGVRTVLTLTPLISAVAMAGVSRLPDSAPFYLPMLPCLVVMGFSITTTAVATTVAISTGVAPNEQGMAAALRQAAFQLGVALGVSVFVSVAASYTAALLGQSSAASSGAALTAGFRLSLAILAALAALGGLIAFVMLRHAEDKVHKAANSHN